jgi:4-amino-4-deoxy-L-arabinose transferase-like glycosyltransferase
MRARLIVLVVSAAVLYGTFLDHAPIYLAHDEVLNAVNAYAIASTGRDPNGHVFPLYFHILGNYWATPIVTYTTALFLTLLPVSEVSARLPSALIGTASVFLLFLVARQMFQRESMALVAGGLLALTPAHFIHSRLAVDQLYPLPFILGWLWCLGRYLDRPHALTLFASTALLGVGVYSYLASVVMMPVYLLATIWALYVSGRRSLHEYGAAVAGFSLPLFILAYWLVANPTQLTDQLQMYNVYDASRLSPLQGLRRLVNYTSLTSRSGVFYQGFNPSMLFFSGGQSLINGTHRAGVFLFPVAILLPLGCYVLITRPMTPMQRLVLLGFATAPLAGALVEEITVNRMLVIVPFAVLLSTYGVEALLAAPGGRRRALGLALLLLVPLQFGVFYADYMTGYRVRSAFWFERNIRGAVERIVDLAASDPARRVYLSRHEVPWIEWYWPFYLAKTGREHLASRTVYFQSGDVDPRAIPPGTLVLSNADSALHDRLAGSGVVDERIVITEPDGKPSFSIFVR